MSHICLSVHFENRVDTAKPIGMSWQWPKSVSYLIAVSTGTESKYSFFLYQQDLILTTTHCFGITIPKRI